MTTTPKTKTPASTTPAKSDEEIPRPELTDAARQAEERAKQGKPTRAATREPSAVSLERAADEGMAPAKEDE